MTSCSTADQYLLGLLDPFQAAPLKRAIAESVGCSPFGVLVTPLWSDFRASLLQVDLPRWARHTAVTDIWPLGRLTMIKSDNDRCRLVSASIKAWSDIASAGSGSRILTVPFGIPRLFTLELSSQPKRARYVASVQPRGRDDILYRDWAQSWLSASLSHSGWNVADDDARILSSAGRAIM